MKTLSSSSLPPPTSISGDVVDNKLHTGNDRACKIESTDSHFLAVKKYMTEIVKVFGENILMDVVDMEKFAVFLQQCYSVFQFEFFEIL